MSMPPTRIIRAPTGYNARAPEGDGLSRSKLSQRVHDARVIASKQLSNAGIPEAVDAEQDEPDFVTSSRRLSAEAVRAAYLLCCDVVRRTDAFDHRQQIALSQFFDDNSSRHAARFT